MDIHNNIKWIQLYSCLQASPSQLAWVFLCSTLLTRNSIRILVSFSSYHSDTMLMMGIIIVNEIMAVHLIFSVLTISKRNLVGCQLVGLLGVFATFSSAAYHFYLSELILTLSKVFNPKDLSHLKYHFYAILTGLIFSMFAILVEDIGITVRLVSYDFEVLR
jgi:hypothetical protein